MILEAIGHCAGVRTGIHLERVVDPVLVEDVVQFGCVCAQAILIVDIVGDCFVLLQIVDVLIDENEGSIGRKFCDDFRLRLAVFRRQIKIER